MSKFHKLPYLREQDGILDTFLVYVNIHGNTKVPDSDEINGGILHMSLQ